ncbi:phosphoribosyltransferase [Carboxydothermus hydrogenoformans]|uniref:Phosphoribosyl transferase domain protein n=1 Tax=Carboxydothermus hydrogenoformans (strain ATCC BAA-161 / DSM 6008 / Z-2901) TaxID=246194 RepID=Q3AG44_CARHZ|nr:phosphoribosyltransferase family protein [Carboxydothermus hydrogenoformans]ABB13852.1 phosphoribosyl transferase domain protein [Carboxydothermus hydrogenoformans Z-2901]
MYFKDREDAGRVCAAKLWQEGINGDVIAAIPRGGVVVAAPIAEKLKIPLKLILPKKIGAPHNEEVAIGAVTADGSLALNEEYISLLGLSPEVVGKQIKKAQQKIKEMQNIYNMDYINYDYTNKNVLLVDDGLATGFTVLAAGLSLKKRGANSITVVVPVASAEAISLLKNHGFMVFSLIVPEDFYAVGQFYKDFRPVETEEVLALLAKNYSG